ncbi:hypothetical protein EV645_0375 [Kribbella rubisoli]|uniref:Uncharacterized protein n=1 Tax=Kribbella rubisoli TaxID=3075929 RepID=A0A4Q7XGA6_9ACTN|nr:hypothetical protein [Kribbella rubisoli]RZU22294.1 hypothetical protein EV645_0375 [Kribbella rubisoli]
MNPHKDDIWVMNTCTAAELLPHMLERFRLRYQDPLIFGDTNAPEGVVIPFELWRSLHNRALDEGDAPSDTKADPCG